MIAAYLYGKIMHCRNWSIFEMGGNKLLYTMHAWVTHISNVLSLPTLMSLLIMKHYSIMPYKNYWE